MNLHDSLQTSTFRKIPSSRGWLLNRKSLINQRVGHSPYLVAINIAVARKRTVTYVKQYTFSAWILEIPLLQMTWCCLY